MSLRGASAEPGDEGSAGPSSLALRPDHLMSLVNLSSEHVKAFEGLAPGVTPPDWKIRSRES